MSTRKQTKTEQAVRLLCEQNHIHIWDSGESFTIFVYEDTELVIVYHDGWARLSQREVTSQWHDALINLLSYLRQPTK